MKDKNGKMVVENTKIKELWRTYIERISNEEFEWNKDNLEKVVDVQEWVTDSSGNGSRCHC